MARFQSFAGRRERETTPDLTQMVKRPHLERIQIEADTGDGLFDDIEDVSPAFVRQKKEPPRPAMAPILCEVDYDTPLASQFEALARRKFLGLKDYANIEMVRRLPSPTQTGKSVHLLGQHTFGKGADQFGTVRLRALPSSVRYGDMHMLAAYLRANIRVGLGYEFACALPATDGEIYFLVKRFGGTIRQLCTRYAHMQALTSWYYLVEHSRV